VFDDLLELARVTAIAAALHRHAHAIAMHHAHHLARRQEHRVFLAFHAHEAESGAVGTDDTFGGARHGGPRRPMDRVADRARAFVVAACGRMARALLLFQAGCSL
jgi:hypothetical protein